MQLADATSLFLDGYFSTCERSPKTFSAYQCDLSQFGFFAGNAGLGDVTPESVEAWANQMKLDNLAPASIKRKLATLRVFFNYWIRKGELDRSPMNNLRLDIGNRRQLTQTLSIHEVENLLKAARQAVNEGGGPSPSHDLLARRNLAILELMFATGMRVGEVVATQLLDVSLHNRTVRIRGKGGHERLGLLTDDASLNAVADYHARRKVADTTTTALFINVFGNPLSTQGVANALKKTACAAGIDKHVTPHMLRHTIATLLLENGANLRVVQEFLGHASVTTTQRYTHVTKEHLANSIRKHHPRSAILAA